MNETVSGESVEKYDYELPQALIAQKPLEHRDESRLLLMDRSSGEVEHRKFSHVYDELEAGDVLVVNDTKVFKARTFGDVVERDMEPVEVVFLHFDGDAWEVLLRRMRKIQTGMSIDFGGATGKLIRKDEKKGTAYLRMNIDEGAFLNFLGQHGEVPLPPYIETPLKNLNQYQTVYARETGSVAAPTAGLHFTPELLQRIQDKGVDIVHVTLHVGIGTFQQLWWDTLEEHEMHAEFVELPKGTVSVIARAKKEGKRVVAVGTTTTRALEGVAALHEGVLPEAGFSGEVNLFIRPGFEFKVIDALITNFHLPKTTLLVLVSAFAGREQVLKAYMDAIREKYRFYSFGDAMFIG